MMDGDYGDRDAHVFLFIHWRIQVEILEIACHEAGVRSGDDAVEEKFDGGEVGRLSADIACIFNSIAAKSEADTATVSFLGRKAATIWR
jgi:hypothetical protein